jgi:hypothetical protein
MSGFRQDVDGSDPPRAASFIIFAKAEITR